MMDLTNDMPAEEPTSEKKQKGWFNQKNIIILSAIAGFIVILAIIAASGTDMGSIFQNWTQDYYLAFGIAGLFLALFLISTFANMTVLFPVPYGVALAFVAITIPLTDLDIWLVGIIAGTGAAIGEITAYFLGKGSAKLLESGEGRESVQKMKERINKGYAVPLMFVCAATFIPDDPYLILLGYSGYPLWKMLVTYFFGKVTLCVTTLYLAKVAVTVPLVRDFLKILGVSLPGDPPLDPWISFVGWVGVLLLFFLIFYVDWSSKVGRLYRKLSKRGENTVDNNSLPIKQENSYPYLI